MTDHESFDAVDLVRLTEEDRVALREAADLLRLNGEERCGYLAGRLDGLADRVSADLESPN
jgi:hypothetical protein